jgi:hypothetical protein
MIMLVALQVAVPSGTTLSFYAKVTDISGNASACSTGITYQNATNAAPTLSTIAALTGIENDLISFTLSGSDLESNPLTYTCSALCPTGLTVDASTGAVLWRPYHSQHGTFTPSFTVTATGGSATITTSIVISKDVGTGLDGARTISTNIHINNCFPLQSIDGSGNVILGAWVSQPIGRRMLLLQLQDAFTVTSGEQTPRIYNAYPPGDASKWEIVEVQSSLQVGSTWQLSIDRVPSFNYITDGAGKKAQACTVPEYTDLTVNAGASIVAQTWDGLAGGVIAFFVNDDLTVNGSINATAKGLRGGNVFTNNSDGTASYDTVTGGFKGESIQGLSYTKQGRGNYGPSGGGGNSPHAGGGGGGHGGIGGYGGYGNAAMTSTDRGMPGNWIDFSLWRRLMPGAGGGGGQADSGTSDTGKGGIAGGIIFAFVVDFRGTGGTIEAKGENGEQSALNGAGGGGSGGSIWIRANSDASSLVTVNASGGNGGNATCSNCGPGGGGGGGRLSTSSGHALSNVTFIKSGGAAGTNLEGVNYGATSGADGIKE